MIQRSIVLCFAAALISALCSTCSVPSLEDPRCAEAQDRVKRFYSIHFDRHDERAEADPASRTFLTDRLANELASSPEVSPPYFTTGDPFPRAFRAGSCSMRSETSAFVDILLLWRDESKSAQRTMRVSVVNADGSWLIDGVAPV